MSAIAAEKPALSNALAMGSAVVFAALGAFLALKGVDPVMNLHGALLAAASLLALAYIFTHSADDRSGYLDGPIRVATLAAVFWGVIGFAAGDFIAWQLAFPALNFDLPWTTFGRLQTAAYLGGHFCVRR